MNFRIMLIGEEPLTAADILTPEGKDMPPLASIQMIDLGIVSEDDLLEKLAYLLHGVKREYHDKIIVARYPQADVVMTLPDICKAMGVK